MKKIVLIFGLISFLYSIPTDNYQLLFSLHSQQQLKEFIGEAISQRSVDKFVLALIKARNEGIEYNILKEAIRKAFREKIHEAANQATLDEMINLLYSLDIEESMIEKLEKQAEGILPKPAIVIIPNEELIQKEELVETIKEEVLIQPLKEEVEVLQVKEEPVLIYGGKIDVNDLDYEVSLVAKKTKSQYLKFGIPVVVAALIGLYFYYKKINSSLMLDKEREAKPDSTPNPFPGSSPEIVQLLPQQFSAPVRVY